LQQSDRRGKVTGDDAFAVEYVGGLCDSAVVKD
jgi:hypothetical protein